MEPSSHYFSSSPTGDGAADAHSDRRDLRVRLAGQDLHLETAPGVFSFTELDRGTQALLDTALVPAPDSQARILDIGSGWGPITVTMGLHAPQAQLTAVDVNDRALALTTDNARRAGITNLTVAHPEEIPAEAQFDLIYSNPPIRVGKDVLHAILTRWLPTLSAPEDSTADTDHGGEAWLVVAKKLGADSLQPWIDRMLAENLPSPDAAFAPVERVDTVKGFRILRIVRTA